MTTAVFSRRSILVVSPRTPRTNRNVRNPMRFRQITDMHLLPFAHQKWPEGKIANRCSRFQQILNTFSERQTFNKNC